MRNLWKFYDICRCYSIPILAYNVSAMFYLHFMYIWTFLKCHALVCVGLFFSFLQFSDKHPDILSWFSPILSQFHLAEFFSICNCQFSIFCIKEIEIIRKVWYNSCFCHLIVKQYRSYELGVVRKWVVIENVNIGPILGITLPAKFQ